MGVSFLLCLLPALLATASAEVIKCVRCRGSAAECQDRTRTCRADTDTGGCISTVEVNTLGGIPVTGYVKGCLSDYYSGIIEPVSFTVRKGLYLRVNNVRCRNGDKCNSGPMEPPQENSTLNGRQCPACLAFGAQTCTSQIIHCTGEETYCGDFAGTLHRGFLDVAMFAAQGCVTPSARGISVVYGLVSGIHTFYFDHASVRAAEPVPSPGASTQPRSQHPATEAAPSPGASTQPRSQHPATEPAPSPGASTQPLSYVRGSDAHEQRDQSVALCPWFPLRSGWGSGQTPSRYCQGLGAAGERREHVLGGSAVTWTLNPRTSVGYTGKRTTHPSVSSHPLPGDSPPDGAWRLLAAKHLQTRSLSFMPKAPILAWRSAAMTTGLVTLCLLGALHATAAVQNDTGVPLSCFYCKSGQRCHHTPQTCSSPQDACIVVHERNTLGADTSGTFQACADSRRSLTGFLAFYFGLKVTVEIQSEICKSDDCNSESTPPRLAINNVPNGRECQACYAPGFQSCQPAGSLLCLGGADQCADVVGTLEQGNVTIPFAARGCATQAACSITTLESGVFTYKLTKTSCKPAPKALPSGAPRMLVWGPLSSIIPLFLPALLGPFLC
ncbi:uncharacterized protein LOC106731821 [Pelodiscus sinensis]|uniref:uncharacterized protein LOC106731821 n=1 Tax=Pelodiscus sinensis TaxID=13735 RepID=UPI003F6D7AB0